MVPHIQHSCHEGPFQLHMQPLATTTYLGILLHCYLSREIVE